MRKLLVGILAAATMLYAVPAQSQNAVGAWNDFAGQYNFGSQPTPTPVTFEQSYTGSNFEADFAGIMNAVANALNTGLPDFEGDDLASVSLNNWPDA
jgi:hypothetical protein